MFQNIPAEIRKQNFQNAVEWWTYKAEFETTDQLFNFFNRCFGHEMVITSNNGSQTSQNFAAAYGFIIQSSTVPMYHNYAAKLRTQNMSILCISCAGNQGTLQGNEGDTVKHFAFIIDQACLIKN